VPQTARPAHVGDGLDRIHAAERLEQRRGPLTGFPRFELVDTRVERAGNLERDTRGVVVATESAQVRLRRGEKARRQRRDCAEELEQASRNRQDDAVNPATSRLECLEPARVVERRPPRRRASERAIAIAAGALASAPTRRPVRASASSATVSRSPARTACGMGDFQSAAPHASQKRSVWETSAPHETQETATNPSLDRPLTGE
jgi:hypothetical protein